MVLTVLCSGCLEPKQFSMETELYLLYSRSIICGSCQHETTVTKEVKDDIRREWGLSKNEY